MSDARPDVTSFEAFGTLLRRYRIDLGLTQDELAERTGVSKRSIGNMERGVPHTPRKDTLTLLADALALDPTERAQFAEAARRLGRAPPRARCRRRHLCLPALSLSPQPPWPRAWRPPSAPQPAPATYPFHWP